MKSNNVLMFFMGLLLLLVGGMGGYIYFQSQTRSTYDEITIPISPTPTQEMGSIVNPTNTVVPSPTGTSVLITIENEVSLPALDVSELKARVIQPFVDYNAEAYADDALLTVTVKKNTQASSVSYPYLLDSVSKKGVTHGVSIAKTDGHIQWWAPECMGSCNLSASFKAKYPEVAKISP
jgi:hypothetical protein